MLGIIQGIKKPHLAAGLKINHRRVSREISRGGRNNYGFKLQSSSNNDPFTIINFYSLGNVDYYPVMRVIYVKP